MNRADEVLSAIEARCLNSSSVPRIKIKFHQSRAFVRYKQSKFAECVTDFERQEELIIEGAEGFEEAAAGKTEMGFCKSAALNENIGHCMSSMNKLDQAEKRFTTALQIIKAAEENQDAPSAGTKCDVGGIYLGLGLVKDRLGNSAGAVPVLESAVAHYKSVHGADGSSLVAKALSSVGKTKEKCGHDEEAGEHYAEAVAVFRKTTGRGPLLAGALALFGKNMLRRLQFMAAGKALAEGCDMEVDKDALDLNSVWEILDNLKRAMLGIVQTKGGVTPDAKELAGEGFALAERAIQKAANDWKEVEGPLNPATHGTTALFEMLAGEFSFANGSLPKAKPHLANALVIFTRVPGDTCAGLISTCTQLLAACPPE